jgi:hypothetical protein
LPAGDHLFIGQCSAALAAKEGGRISIVAALSSRPSYLYQPPAHDTLQFVKNVVVIEQAPDGPENVQAPALVRSASRYHYCLGPLLHELLPQKLYVQPFLDAVSGGDGSMARRRFALAQLKLFWRLE